MSATCGIRELSRLLGVPIAIYSKSGMSGKLWLGCKRAECNKYCMSCHGKDMGQLLMDYEGVWSIGTLRVSQSLKSWEENISAQI